MTTEETITNTVNIATNDSYSIISLITSTDFMGKSVLLILFMASIWSWGVIIAKIFYISRTNKLITKFEVQFWSGQVLDKLYEKVKNNIDNPLAGIFASAMQECKRNNKTSSDSILKISYKDRILQSMNLVRDREMEKLESNLSFLAIVGSSATFIGLFGTVWGIMHSFQSIAASKNTTLAVVAPGIAEALFATAVGLIAAIPAVIFHTYLTTKIIAINNKIDDFIGELNTLLSRAIDEGQI